MIIGIDGNEANQTVRVGVGQYAYHIIKELYRIDKKNEYFIYLKNPPLRDMPTSSKKWHYRVFGPTKLWTKFALPLHLFLDGINQDIFFSPSHYSPHFSPFPTIPTIHDLGYLQSLDQFNKKDIYQLVEWTKHSLSRAKHIIAVSQFTKNDIVKTYHISPKNVSIVPNGVGTPPILTNNQTTKTLAKFNIDAPYFLALGTLKPNKNYPFLIEAFSKYLHKNKISELKLVIAGKKGWLFDSVFQTVRDLRIEDKVIFTDYINESEKWILLKNSLALVIPSTYEGFGIPAIESQAVGTPVISSNIPSLVEVLDNTAIFIDPSDTKGLVQALDNVQKPQIRQKLSKMGLKRSKKYTWEKAAQSLLKAFDTI